MSGLIRVSRSFSFLLLTVLGTETRQTYRAVLSEPKLVIPKTSQAPNLPAEPPMTEGPLPQEQNSLDKAEKPSEAHLVAKKRPREGEVEAEVIGPRPTIDNKGDYQKKKRKKNNKGAQHVP